MNHNGKTIEIIAKKLECNISEVLDKTQNIYWYNRGLIELYIRYGSFRAVQKQTKIPYTAVRRAVYKGIEDSKNNIVGEITMKDSVSIKELLTRKEVSILLSVKPNTIATWERKKLIRPFCHINKRPRYTKGSLESIIKKTSA